MSLKCQTVGSSDIGPVLLARLVFRSAHAEKLCRLIVVIGYRPPLAPRIQACARHAPPGPKGHQACGGCNSPTMLALAPSTIFRYRSRPAAAGGGASTSGRGGVPPERATFPTRVATCPDAAARAYYQESGSSSSGKKARKKLAKLTKSMRKDVDKARALLAAQQQPSAEAGAEALLPRLQALHAEFTALCDAAMAELPAESSSSSSESDDDRRRTSSVRVVQHRPQQHHQQQPQQHASGSTPAASSSAGTVTVCQGKACRKAGADALLAAFCGAAPADVQVGACKCMGRCKQGPAAKLEPASAGVAALHTCLHPTAARGLLSSYFAQQAPAEQQQRRQPQPLLVSPPGVDHAMGLC